MFEFCLIYAVGVIVTAIVLGLATRGEEYTYGDIPIVLILLALWPLGLTLTLWAVADEKLKGKGSKVAFTMPGGKK